MDEETTKRLRASLDLAGFWTGPVTVDAFGLVPVGHEAFRTVPRRHTTLLGFELPPRDFLHDAPYDRNRSIETATPAVRMLRACRAAGVDPTGWPMVRMSRGSSPWVVTIPGAVL